MKNRTFITCLLLGVIIQSVVFGGEIKSDELVDMIKQLQEQVTDQQNVINELKKQVEGQDKSPVVAEQESHEEVSTPGTGDVDGEQSSAQEMETGELDPHENLLQKGYGVIKEVVGVEFNKGIDGLTLKGDARFRYERQERKRGTNPEETRDRQRVRLRLGGVWANLDDNWEIGIGIATGNAESTSTNDTFSDNDVFESGDLRLDYAYARHSWEYLDLVIGQQKNPWKDTTTFIMWDGDIRPIGVTAKYAMEGLFATGGIYDVFHFGRDEADALLFAGQLGYKLAVDDLEYIIALGYWWFNDATVDNGVPDNTLPPGVSTDNAPGIPDGIDDDFDFNVGDIYSHVKMKRDGVEVRLYGHYLQNFGAEGNPGSGQLGGNIDPEDNDQAYVFGVEGKVGDFKLGLAYARIESDSIYREIKDSDFGDTGGLTDTDVKGIKANVKYGFTKTMSLGLTYMDLSEIDGTDRDGELYQLDLVYKF